MSEAQRVVVIQNASKDISSIAIKWAIDGLSLKPGDELTLLGVLDHVNNPMGYRSRIDPDSMLGPNQTIINQEVTKKEEEYQNSKEMLQISKFFEMKKISFHIRVAAASSAKLVALEAAKNLNATWIILDRQMKKDSKYFMDGLSCGISRIKRNDSVVLLRGPKITKRNAKHTEGSQSRNVTYSEMLPGQEIEPGILEKIHETHGDEDLFSLEFFPMKSKNPLENSSSDELGIYSRKGQVGASSVTSSSTSSLNKKPALLDTVTNPDQTNPDCLSGFSVSDAKLAPLQLQEDNFISTQRAAADDDSSVVISSFYKMQCIGSNENSNQKTEQEQAKITEEILTYEFTNRQLEDGTEYHVCLYCWNERPKIEVKRDFTYAELYTATNGFSTENFLSEGGFGYVYKGKLKDGHQIAVKQYKHASLQGEKEFRSEVRVLSKARHKNVVMLLGSCSEGRHRLLVYEYICNGSLDTHLSKHSLNILRWKYRMKIALGVARGLNYLHQNNIIHRDTRPNNILTTHDYEPLLGDFGLARTQQTKSERLPEKKVKKVVGAIGYLAPEYAERGRVSTKTDVYSFGVVLLELITGRSTADKTLQEKSLVGWARPLLKEKKYPELIDDRILDCHDVHQLFWMVRVAEICLRKDPDRRPSMEQVEHALECITEGETVTGIEEFSPTYSSDSSLKKPNEPQGEQEQDIQESASANSPSFSKSQMGEALSTASLTQSSSGSLSASTSSGGSFSDKGKSFMGKGESSLSQQVLYDEMLN